MVEKDGRPLMKRIALSEVKDKLSEYLRMAEEEEIVIAATPVPCHAVGPCPCSGETG